MKNFYCFFLLCINLALKAQNVCNPSGNLMLFTNYDGGTLTINVDQNIPNLKIGICSYEAVHISLTGAFLANVTGVHYAGYNSNNNHCGAPVIPTTTIVGAPIGAVTTTVYSPASPIPNANGNSNIICAYSCSLNSNQGGCNTVDQVEAYFLSYFPGSSLYAHKVQYGCWTGTHSLSGAGNCCPTLTVLVYPGVVSSSQTLCAGGSPVSFSSVASATASSGTINYQWESSTISSSAGFSPVFGATGATYFPGTLGQTTYYRRAANTTSNNTAYSNVITMTVLQPPPVSISGPTAVCMGQSATLTATGGTSYAWSQGFGGGASIVISPTTMIAIVNVTCFPVNNCTVSTTYSLAVNPTPNFVPQVVNFSVCVGETNTLSAMSPGSGIVSYTWQPGNLTGNQVTVAALSTTVYTVTGTTPANCSNTATVSFIVHPLPTITIVPETNPVCTAKQTSLVAGGALSYTWMPGGSTDFSLSVAPTSQVVYTVTGSDSHCTSVATLTLGVLATPVVTFNTSKNKICAKETSLLTALGGTAYAWLNTGITTVTANTVNVAPTITTSYSVVVTGTNGCTDAAVRTITVSACTGIDSYDSGVSLKIFPNPNSGEFNVTAATTAEIRLISASGQLIREVQLNEKNNYTLSVTNLAPGVYFIVSGSGDRITRQKILVSR